MKDIICNIKEKLNSQKETLDKSFLYFDFKKHELTLKNRIIAINNAIFTGFL
jgi:hypothetical protein